MLLLSTISLLMSQISCSRSKAAIRARDRGSLRLVDSKGVGTVLAALASLIGAAVHRRLQRTFLVTSR
jgi:hypothetical protein